MYFYSREVILKYLNMLLFAPLIIFPALAFAFLFISAPFMSPLSSFDKIWSGYVFISMFALAGAYIGNTLIGFPIIYILNKFNRLNLLNILSCLLMLLLIIMLLDNRLSSDSFVPADSFNSLLWFYLGMFYFALCVAATDYFMVKSK